MNNQEVLMKIDAAGQIRDPMATIIEMGYEILSKQRRIDALEKQVEELKNEIPIKV